MRFSAPNGVQVFLASRSFSSRAAAVCVCKVDWLISRDFQAIDTIGQRNRLRDHDDRMQDHPCQIGTACEDKRRGDKIQQKVVLSR